MLVWAVEETACYPCKWKVVHVQELRGVKSDNDTSNYFRTLEEAQEEAARRNAREVDAEPQKVRA
jgi:hypothetical protein